MIFGDSDAILILEVSGKKTGIPDAWGFSC
jgi:hypothetical protein